VLLLFSWGAQQQQEQSQQQCSKGRQLPVILCMT